MLWRVAVCCIVKVRKQVSLACIYRLLRCGVAVCVDVLQRVAVCFGVLQRVEL